MQNHKSKFKIEVARIGRRGFALVCIMVFTAGLASARYSGGTGEPNDPYRIGTPNDLNDIGNHLEDFNKCFVMVNDINLAAYTGTQFNIIGGWVYAEWDPGEWSCAASPFRGVFDGNGCEIRNFSYISTGNAPCSGFSGIFGWVDDVNAVIRRVGIKGASVYDPWWTHPLPMTSVGVGSLIGTLSNGTVTGCYVEGCSVSGVWGTGGLIGQNNYGVISNCFATGQVSGMNVGGGLVGINNDGGISNCFATGSAYGRLWAGGLVGGNGGLIRNCYAHVAADSNEDAGGLVGSNSGDVLNCFASGVVDANVNIGGFVGNDGRGSYTKCFWDETANPDVNGIGNTTDPNVIAKITAEMQTESTFTDAGWDFVEVWGIGEGQTYPFLRKYLAGDANHDGIVDWQDFTILALHWLEGR
jgi:hypothetical protein